MDKEKLRLNLATSHSMDSPRIPMRKSPRITVRSTSGNTSLKAGAPRSRSANSVKRLRSNGDAPILSPRKQVKIVGNYDLGRTIGSGHFGKVKIATHVLTRDEVAIKIIQKKKIPKEALALVTTEIAVLKTLKHPNIIRLYEVIETDRMYFLIQELAGGGEALDFVHRKKLPENRAQAFFRQIASALAYCHERNIAHRDLKAENLLVDDNMNIKVIDFGLCARFAPGELLTQPCGSAYYIAPELTLVDPHYDGPSADIWSLGVVLYYFVCGTLPFKADSADKIFKMARNEEYTLPDFLSVELQDLLQSILQSNVSKRSNIKEILEHPWVVGAENWKYIQIPLEDNNAALLHEIDPVILMQMEMFGFDRENVIKSLQEGTYDQNSGIFNLLLCKKHSITLRKNVNRREIRTLSKTGQDHSTNQSYLSGAVSMPNSTESSPCNSPGSLSPNLCSEEGDLTLIPEIDDNYLSGLPTTTPTILFASALEEKYSNTLIVPRRQRNVSLGSSSERLSGLRLCSDDGEHYGNTNEKEIEEERNGGTDKGKALRKTVSQQHLEYSSELEPKPKLKRFEVRKPRSSSTSKEPTKNVSATSVSSTQPRLSTLISSPDEPRTSRTPFLTTSTKKPLDIMKMITLHFEEQQIPFEFIGTFALKALFLPLQLRFEIEVCCVPNLENFYSIRMQRVSGEWEEYRALCDQILSQLDV